MKAHTDNTTNSTRRSLKKGTSLAEKLSISPERAALLMHRAHLMRLISEYIEERKLTQSVAADLLGIRQADVSHLMQGLVHKFRLDRLVEIVGRAGIEIEIMRVAIPKASSRSAFTSTTVNGTRVNNAKPNPSLPIVRETHR